MQYQTNSTQNQRASKPTRIDLKLGFVCNNRCRFCVQGNKREKYGPKPFEVLKQIIESNANWAEGVVFTGGEPSLYPRLLELINLARDLSYTSIQIQTNGRMFAYRQFCQEAISAGANEFSPALHGHVDELHDYLTQVKGAFDQTIQAIRNLKSLGQTVITNSVITRSNYRALKQLALLLIDLGVDQYQLAFVHPVGGAGKNNNFYSIVPRLELVQTHVHAALDVGIAKGVQVMAEAIPFCFMKGYEKHLAETLMPQTKIFDAEGVIQDYESYRRKSGKLLGPKCGKCIYFQRCEGPWKEYVQEYGWTEFTPCN